jgi:hypothetical protein
VSGHAGHAGQCSTWAVSRSGRQTKAPLPLASKHRMDNSPRLGSGAAPAATYPRTNYPSRFRAGAKRRTSPSPCPDCPPSRVARLVRDRGYCPRNALIHVPSPATPARALHVLKWARPSPVSAANRHSVDVALIPTMNVAGVVAKFAAISCLVGSTSALCHATKAHVARATSASPRDATVDTYRRISCVAIGKKSEAAASRTLPKMDLWL